MSTTYGINFINKDGTSPGTEKELLGKDGYASLEEALKDYNAWIEQGNFAEIWQIDRNESGSHVFQERCNHNFTRVMHRKDGSKWDHGKI